MDERFKELVREETTKGFWAHFEGRKKFTEPLSLAVISVIFTFVVLFVVNGEITVNEIWVAIIPTIGVPVLWAFLVWYRSRTQAPMKLYLEKEKLAWRRTWHDVEIKVINYLYDAGVDVGLSIVSDKPDEYEITNFYPKVIKILQGRHIVYQSSVPDVGIELDAIEKKSNTGAFYPRRDALNVPHRKSIGESVVAFRVANSYDYTNLDGNKENNVVIEGLIEESGKETKRHLESISLPCRVEITLNGLLNTSDKMDLCILVCEIQEDKEKGLAMTMTRSQEYEYRKKWQKSPA